jgi:hypothetical protein
MRRAITKACARNSFLSAVRSHFARRLHVICAAVSQSCHNVGSTGEPSADFKPRDEVDFLVRLAKPQQNRFEKDSHRVIRASPAMSPICHDDRNCRAT